MKSYSLFAGLILSFQAHAACMVIDDAGKQINISKPAQRIISLAPDLTEILFVIGAGPSVLGAVEGSDYPYAAKAIPRVGNYTGIDLERILLFHPDLIVTWSKTFVRQLAPLEKQGIPIYTADSHRLEDIPRNIKNLGCLTGTQTKATAVAEHFSQRLNQLQAKYGAQKKMRVFYQIGSYSLFTINKESWINQVITLCGGENVFANAKTIAPEVSWESVVVANPQVIMSDATTANWKQRWNAWPEMTAVKNQWLFSIHPDLIDRAGPRLLEGAKQMCESLEKARAF